MNKPVAIKRTRMRSQPSAEEAFQQPVENENLLKQIHETQQGRQNHFQKRQSQSFPKTWTRLRVDVNVEGDGREKKSSPVSLKCMAPVLQQVTDLSARATDFSHSGSSFIGDFLADIFMQACHRKEKKKKTCPLSPSTTCETLSPYSQYLCTTVNCPYQENHLSDLCRPRESSDWDKTW